MVVDAVRTYLDAANGLTELSRRDAVAAARALLRSDGKAVGATAAEGEAAPRVGQSIQALAGELIETSQANRSAIADLVREEVGRQLQGLDVVPREEHERLARRVAELERRLAARHAVERALMVENDASEDPSSAGQDERGDETGPRAEAAVVEREGASGGDESDLRSQDSPGEQDTSEAQDAPQERAEDTPEVSSVAGDEGRADEGPPESADTSAGPAARSTAVSGSAKTAPAESSQAGPAGTAKSSQAKSAKGKSTGKRSTKAKSKK
ncbi:hypothetical protein [Nocardiopsis xinjiangensis]|uniref:hypothetical protein n=1 Tax=Nocardiopsis xinjiangensis TaxID=124285 RepID=UPI00034CC0BF|nr:hypothetical protein [Nocardiopsis xinjiangensis]